MTYCYRCRYYPTLISEGYTSCSECAEYLSYAYPGSSFTKYNHYSPVKRPKSAEPLKVTKSPLNTSRKVRSQSLLKWIG